jgi:hypothetical protein
MVIGVLNDQAKTGRGSRIARSSATGAPKIVHVKIGFGGAEPFQKLFHQIGNARECRI